MDQLVLTNVYTYVITRLPQLIISKESACKKKKKKNLPAIQEMQVQSLGQEDPLEDGMATHSSILA